MKTVEDWQNSGLGFVNKDLIQMIIDDVTAHHQSTIKELSGELEQLKKEGDTLRACIKDDTETEADAKKEALKVLPPIQVEGDSYGVPNVASIVADLVALVTTLKSQLEQRDVALGVALMALEKWKAYWQTCETGPLVDPEQAGEDFTTAWFEAEEAISAIHKLKGGTPP